MSVMNKNKKSEFECFANASERIKKSKSKRRKKEILQALRSQKTLPEERDRLVEELYSDIKIK